MTESSKQFANEIYKPPPARNFASAITIGIDALRVCAVIKSGSCFFPLPLQVSSGVLITPLMAA